MNFDLLANPANSGVNHMEEIKKMIQDGNGNLGLVLPAELTPLRTKMIVPE